MLACKNCKSVFFNKVSTCPVCNSEDITDKMVGMVIVFDAAHSEIAKAAGIMRNGRFAINPQ